MPFNIDNWKLSWDRAKEYVLNGTVIQQADRGKQFGDHYGQIIETTSLVYCCSNKKVKQQIGRISEEVDSSRRAEAVCLFSVAST